MLYHLHFAMTFLPIYCLSFAFLSIVFILCHFPFALLLIYLFYFPFHFPIQAYYVCSFSIFFNSWISITFPSLVQEVNFGSLVWANHKEYWETVRNPLSKWTHLPLTIGMLQKCLTYREKNDSEQTSAFFPFAFDFILVYFFVISFVAISIVSYIICLFVLVSWHHSFHLFM